MSVGRMLLSGVLVAGGLVLGTFTLHGYLDPSWTQKQLAASAAVSKPAAVVQAIPEQFPSRSRFVASEPAADVRPPTVKASSRPAATPSAVRQPDTKTAAAKPSAKTAIKKKVADKPKQPPAPPAQQASLQFPWNWKLFGN
jgi:hypothetical protein